MGFFLPPKSSLRMPEKRGEKFIGEAPLSLFLSLSWERRREGGGFRDVVKRPQRFNRLECEKCIKKQALFAELRSKLRNEKEDFIPLSSLEGAKYP